MTSRLPHPSPLKRPETVLHEEQNIITLESSQNLYESIARRTQAYYRQMVTHLRVNKEMCLSQLSSHFVHPLYKRMKLYFLIVVVVS